METGVARKPVADLDKYRDSLESRLGRSKEIMRVFIHKAQEAPKRIVFPEGVEEKILRASQIILDEEIATPILLGDKTVIEEKAKAARSGPDRCRDRGSEGLRADSTRM